jgi:hypothetical protein
MADYHAIARGSRTQISHFGAEPVSAGKGVLIRQTSKREDGGSDGSRTAAAFSLI